MTVSPGAPWGEPWRLAPSDVVVGTDADLAAAIAAASPDRPTVGVIGGDLARTVGAGAGIEDLSGPHAHRFPIDVLQVRIGDEEHVAVAHVVVSRRWWAGPFAVVMNAEWLGDLDLTPRGHPNDGRAELLTGRLPVRQRLAARSRARHGEHLPHPALELRSRRRHQIPPIAGARVRLDGTDIGASTLPITVTVEPDAAWIVVSGRRGAATGSGPRPRRR